MLEWRFKKIHHKFMVLFLVLMVLGVGIIGWFSFYVIEKAVVSNAVTQMQHRLENALHHTENFHARAREVMGLASKNSIFKEYFSLPESRAGNQFDAAGVLKLSPAQKSLREKLDQWTFALQQQLPIGETCLIDHSGHEHSRITKGQVAPDEELSATENESSFFAPSLRLHSGEVHVTPPYMSADLKQFVFAYTSSIVLDDETVPAFYHFEIPVAYFQEVLRQVWGLDGDSSQNQLNRMFIITPQNRILVDSTHNIGLELRKHETVEGPHDLAHYLPTVSSVSNSPDFLAIMAQTHQEVVGTGTFVENDHTNFVVFKRLPLFDWSLVMVKSYDRLLEGTTSLGSIRLVIYGVGLLVLVVGGLLVWFLVSHIIRPVTQISAAMQRLEKDEIHQEVVVGGADELTTMARVFNQMSAEIRRNAAELYQEKNKLTTIIHSSREAILVSDEEGRVVLVNPEAERLLDKTTEQIVTDGFMNLLDDPAYLQAFLDRQGVNMPEILVYKNRVLNFFAATIKNEAGKNIGSAALIRDVTAEKQLEEKLRLMSFTDKLTGLYNRRWMEDLLAKEFSRSSRYGMELSLLFFDVDHFKKFNDTYGHDMGDRVLEVIGNAAKLGFRKTDFACRYGGEEFCVILPNTGTIGAQIAAEHFRKDVESLRVDGLQVTITIGVATFPLVACRTCDELLKAADTALYEGKRGGRNRIVVALASLAV